ncbi:781_t:CDS:2, partial [Funneliformis geosporum]
DDILVNAADNKFGEEIVETSSNGKKYRKAFRNNMTVIGQPIITACSKCEYTIIGFSKLDEANNDDGRNAEDCTLILTDSVKSLAVAGLDVITMEFSYSGEIPTLSS